MHIRGGPKKVSHNQIIKNRNKANEIRFLCQIKNQLRTIILSVGIKYSVHDLLRLTAQSSDMCHMW